MSSVLHQVLDPNRQAACFARCAAGDAVVLMAAIPAADVPPGVLIYRLAGTDTGAIDATEISDDQWVELLLRYPLNLTW